MTVTCRDIIKDAYDESDIIGAHREPNSREATLGLRRLNTVLDELVGMGVGEKLSELEVSTDVTLAVNTRAVVNGLGGALTIALPDAPSDGSRVQILDADAAFATYNVTIARNGRLLEGLAADITAATAGYSRTWLYRADLASWQAVEALSLEDDFPFPADTHQIFALLLAQRLGPPNGSALAPDSQMALARGLSRLRARYRQKVVTRADNGVLRLSRQAYVGGFR